MQIEKPKDPNLNIEPWQHDASVSTLWVVCANGAEFHPYVNYLSSIAIEVVKGEGYISWGDKDAKWAINESNYGVVGRGQQFTMGGELELVMQFYPGLHGGFIAASRKLLSRQARHVLHEVDEQWRRLNHPEQLLISPNFLHPKQGKFRPLEAIVSKVRSPDLVKLVP